ncbi:MAG: glutaredoxin family protein [Nanoarchaeota archaeon]|nr:glutaredoxin family protein [Nanoarchaeota archaeon]
MVKVVLYTTGGCLYSNMAKDFLKEHKIKFEERRIDLKDKFMEELLKIVPDDGTPVLIVDGKIYRNFNGEELKKIFKVKG